MDSIEQLLASTAADATAATVALDQAAAGLLHQASAALVQAAETADPARRRLRRDRAHRTVALARQLERLVAIQQRAGLLAADTLLDARQGELS